MAGQAANGSLSASERRALNETNMELQDELKRIIGATKFNDISLFDSGTKASGAKQTISSAFAGGGSRLAISSDGRYISYAENDKTIYQFDLETGIKKALTNSGATAISLLKSNQDGSRLVYKNGQDLFLYSRETDQVTQITDTQGANTITDFDFSVDGTTVALVTDTEYVSGGTVASGATETGIHQIYSINLDTDRIQSYESGDINAISLFNAFKISPNGDHLTFSNSYTGSLEIRYLDLRSAGSSVQQITSGFASITISAHSIDVSNSGKIYFVSNADWGGQNPSGNKSVMEYNTATESYRNITGDGVDVNVFYQSFELSDDGRKISFFSRQNITGENPDLNNTVFSADVGSGQISQVTDGSISVAENEIYFAGDGGSFISRGLANLYYIDLSKSDTDLNISTGSSDEGIISTKLKNLFAELRGIGTYQISSADGGRTALNFFSGLSEDLNSIRGEYSAFTKRMESAYQTTLDQANELDIAGHRIMDVDIAEATAKYVGVQIRQQAQTALFAQVNQMSQLAIDLLQTEI